MTYRKSVSIADVVEVVRELAPLPGAETSAGEIGSIMKDRFLVGEKTVQRRLVESCKAGYLRTVRKGFYRLGAKPLKR